METDEQLKARYEHVCKEHAKAKAKLDKAKTGRDAKARWAGSLNFTKAQIEDEMVRRGLRKDPYEA